MKILIFGGTGYIGSEFISQFKTRGIEFQSYSSRDQFSINTVYDHNFLEKMIVYYLPDAIVNCAAFVGNNNISDCEYQKDVTINDCIWKIIHYHF